MEYSQEDKTLRDRIAALLFYENIVPRKKAPTVESLKPIASMIIRQRYRSVVRDLLVKSVYKTFKTRIRPYSIYMSHVLWLISDIMAIFNRPLKDHPKKNRASGIIESIRICCQAQHVSNKTFGTINPMTRKETYENSGHLTNARRQYTIEDL